ncbi:MAG: hypothetical protein Q9M92_05760 [Enterobacterales bacterium]|nr:hypothetical protein [Enterobacterales bacterium]
MASKKHWSEEQLSSALVIAIRLKNKLAVNALINHSQSINFDFTLLRDKISEFERRNFISLRRLRFIYSFHSLVFFELWKFILVRDKRSAARLIAKQAIQSIIGPNEASLIVKQCEMTRQGNMQRVNNITKSLCKKVKMLLEKLLEMGIVAVNIDNGGWSPGDHGWERVESMLYSSKELWEHFGISSPETAKMCYTDLKFYRKECENDEDGHRTPLTSVCIYFFAETSELAIDIGNDIVNEAKKIGLRTRWSGDPNHSIAISYSG